MNIYQELALLEHIAGGVDWVEETTSRDKRSQVEDYDDQHPFFKPEIDYSYKPAKREQDWANFEQLLAHACIIMAKVKNGSLGKFDAYMMVIGKWPEMFDYENEIVLEKPCLQELFDIIKQF